MNMVYDAEERSEDCLLSEHTLEYSVSLLSSNAVQEICHVYKCAWLQASILFYILEL